MEFFRNPTIDWIGKKWYFIAASLLLSTAGIISLIVKGGPRYGIDFRGGTLVHVKFREAPSLEKLRAALDSQGMGNSTLQSYGPESNHEILVGLEQVVTKEEDLDAGRRTIVNALRQEFGGNEKPNWNEASVQGIADALLSSESLRSSGLSAEQTQDLARRLAEFRDSPPRSGLIGSFEELRPVEGVTPAVLQALEDHFSLAGFTVRNVEVVGPKVGSALRRQALNAALLGLVAMLVYIAFRFEWIYGVAATLATLHDVVIAVGFLSLAKFEISLTVIAALLTLIGYSVNDTIVVFDRIRENVKLMRRASITEITNRSINQTLSRTILTSGLTFLTVLALFLLGGEVLRAFSFTLVVGIVVGTYSSIAVASTVVVSWQEYNNRDRQGAVATLDRDLVKGDRAKLSAGVKA